MIEQTLREIVEDVFRAYLPKIVHEIRNATPSQDEFLSPDEAAKLYHVDSSTIRKLVAKGRLRRYGSSARLLRVSRRELDEVMANRANAPATDAEIEARAEAFLARRR